MIVPKVSIKRILYPTDLSDSARYAFAYAVNLANRYRAHLVMMHVIEEVADIDEKVVGYISADRWEEIKKRNEQETRTTLAGKRRSGAGMVIAEVLEQFCSTAKEAIDDVGFETEDTVVTRGSPVEQIIAQAKERECDLIVMGTHGQGTFKDAVMGSTARRVLRRSQIPVLVVRLPPEKSAF